MLPSNLMWSGVLEIWNEVEDSGWGNELRPLFEHYERYWLPRKDELCVYNLEERTNNKSESDNHALASVIPQNRPNIWHLIGGFVQLEYLAYCDKVATDSLRAVSGSRKWKSVWNDDIVQRAVQRLQRGEITLAHFLHSTSYAVLAGIKHGLRLGRQQNNADGEDDIEGGGDESDESSSESDED
ncbi:uncharacterized protein LOC113214896 [Frankliniella occidentalis]|uniref:Uncharacterized protein LOC113214896 n=1 Tax=Frankliniella occidentalis TaxID=133901 RepID=A0A9C6UEY0_FRAOC|nr:uncharacterized protein LOC113214896 [Frankliniella occidentalis]